jgi:hypothetical protein
VAALTYPGRQQVKYHQAPGIVSNSLFPISLPTQPLSLRPTFAFPFPHEKKNARRIRLDIIRRRTLESERRGAVVEQGSRVVLTRAGPCWEDTAAGPPRRCESGIVGIDKRGKPSATKDGDGKRRMGRPAGDGITTTRNAAHDVGLGQHSTG